MLFTDGPRSSTLQHGAELQASTSAYSYKPLEPRHIRLFRATQSGSDISCEMKHFSLEDCPQFNALSYAWGSGSFSQRISFQDNKYHLITGHLHQGLISVLTLLSPPWLWVDQICIDQSDSEDKASQVALMGDIYASATRTIVWLGQNYQKSDLAMSHVEGIAELIRGYEFDANLVTQTPVELGFPHEDEQVWPAFQCLFSRPWWKRLWIIQEAIKAQDVVFVVGNQLASYDNFITLASAHERLIRLVVNGTHVLGILTGLSKAFYCLRNETLGHIDEFRTGKSAAVNGKPGANSAAQFAANMFGVLEFSRNQLCGEPVDRVYAILGLVGDYMRENIKIDYSEENKEQYWRVYLQFHRLLISLFLDGGYLFTTITSGSHTSTTPDPLPSWCPELVNPQHISRPYLPQPGAGSIPSCAEWKPDYRMIEPCNSNLSILHVTGVRVDLIKTIIPLWSAPRPVRFDKFTCGDATNIKKLLMPCFKLAETLRKSSEDFTWMDTLFRTWVMNTRAYSNDRYPADTIGTDCLAFMNRLTAIINHSHHEHDLNATEVSEEATRYASSFFEYTRGRAVFMTEEGKLGMCDAAAEVGDEVAIWFNCAYPVVQRVLPGKGGCEQPKSKNEAIDSTEATTTHDNTDVHDRSWLPGKFPGERREQQHRRLLGHCYVDGLMHGEIFSERDFGTEGYSNFLIV